MQEISVPSKDVSDSNLGSNKNPSMTMIIQKYHKRAATPEAKEKKHILLIERMNTTELPMPSSDNEPRVLIKDLKRPINPIKVEESGKSIEWSAMLDDPKKAHRIAQQYNAYTTGLVSVASNKLIIPKTRNMDDKLKIIEGSAESRFSYPIGKANNDAGSDGTMKKHNKKDGRGFEAKDEDSIQEEDIDKSPTEVKAKEVNTRQSKAVHI